MAFKQRIIFDFIQNNRRGDDGPVKPSWKPIKWPTNNNPRTKHQRQLELQLLMQNADHLLLLDPTTSTHHTPPTEPSSSLSLTAIHTIDDHQERISNFPITAETQRKRPTARKSNATKTAKTTRKPSEHNTSDPVHHKTAAAAFASSALPSRINRASSKHKQPSHSGTSSAGCCVTLPSVRHPSPLTIDGAPLHHGDPHAKSKDFSIDFLLKSSNWSTYTQTNTHTISI